MFSNPWCYNSDFIVISWWLFMVASQTLTVEVHWAARGRRINKWKPKVSLCLQLTNRKKQFKYFLNGTWNNKQMQKKNCWNKFKFKWNKNIEFALFFLFCRWEKCMYIVEKEWDRVQFCICIVDIYMLHQTHSHSHAHKHSARKRIWAMFHIGWH